MKRKTILLFIIILPAIYILSCRNNDSNLITISGAWALYPMSVKWAEEYKKLHPGVRIDISAGGAGKGIADVLNGLVDIGMVSREVYREELNRGAVPVAVARDAVVAVTSHNNPLLNVIGNKGLTVKTAKDIWINGSAAPWDTADIRNRGYRFHIYTRSDACGAAETWAQYLGYRQEDLLGVGVFGDPGLAQAVMQDTLGIGFNNIGYAYDSRTRKPVSGLIVIPLDLNNNGMIDDDESFYENLDSLTVAISSGRYPSPPARELYFVIMRESWDRQVTKDFIVWVLTDGQKYVSEAGYVSLSEKETGMELNKISR